MRKKEAERLATLFAKCDRQDMTAQVVKAGRNYGVRTITDGLVRGESYGYRQLLDSIHEFWEAWGVDPNEIPDRVTGTA